MSTSSHHMPDGSILIVTGSNLRAEEMDRPLAYYIRQHILDVAGSQTGSQEPPPVYVISDFRYLYESNLSKLPTISLGGPGVNALTHKWLDLVPITLAVDDEFYIQIGQCDKEPVRASIWGMDHETTKVGVSTFVENYLSEFLDVCAHRAHHE